MRSSNIGGQAVMEGIMMRHKDKYSIAVRRPDQEIELKVEDYKCIFGNHAFLKKPIIRGVVSFVDSLVVGTKCLMYSAEIAGDEEDEETARKNEQLTEEEKAILTDAAKIFVIKGEPVSLVRGENSNIKITYPYDLTVAESLLKQQDI